MRNWLLSCAILLAVTLALRLGLANLVTVYALCRLSGREALLILAARCLLGALVGGSLTALAFSLTGGLLALGTMALLLRCGRFQNNCVSWTISPVSATIPRV